MESIPPERNSYLDHWRRAFRIWLVLTVLLVATVAGAYLPIGAWKLPLALTIAAAKAALVIVFFMEIGKGTVLVRLAGLAGLLWLLVMFGLTLSDYAFRPGFAAG